jgi:hypothetical protein
MNFMAPQTKLVNHDDFSFQLSVLLHSFSLLIISTPQMLECCFLGSTKLPSPAIFGKSLYTFYIGQNDFTSNLAAIGIGGVKQYLPQVVSQIAGTIKVSTSITCSDWQP